VVVAETRNKPPMLPVAFRLPTAPFVVDDADPDGW
jgi:hypothetical protein